MKTTIIKVRVDPVFLERIKLFADTIGQSVADYTRSALNLQMILQGWGNVCAFMPIQNENRELEDEAMSKKKAK